MSFQEHEIGLVKEILYPDLETAQTKAGAESANTSGHSVPVVIFHQGRRYNMSGALSFAFVVSRLEKRSAPSRGSITDVSNALNRPEITEHSDAIAKYLSDNRSGSYILPPMTLNIQQTVRLHSVDYPGAQVRPGYLVIPATAKLAITDGQHRRSGVIKAMELLTPEERDQLEQDGIAVMITCESNIDQIHQDFADCSKTKALAPSQVAVYDRRNPANRLVVEVERMCPILSGKVDATSQKLGKKSTALFTANQVRQFIKSMIVGSWGMGDLDFEKRARERLGDDLTYMEFRTKIVDFLNTITNACPVMSELAQIKSGVETNRIPIRRNEGWICLTASGLVVMGLIGHEILAKGEENWEQYGRKLGALDWSRTSEHWQGVLVNHGKMITSQSAVKQAVKTARELIGWNPELGAPAPVEARVSEMHSEMIVASPTP